MDGLAVINGGQMYHYKEVGLEYIWLRDGFEYCDTPRGRAVRIHNREELHAAIARWVVTAPNRLRGKEVRYLRSMLNLSQEGLGKLLRHSRATIARWEGEPEKSIPAGSEEWLRIVYMKKAEGDLAVCKLVELLTELDELKNGRSVVREARFKDDNDGGWKESGSGLAG